MSQCLQNTKEIKSANKWIRLKKFFFLEFIELNILFRTTYTTWHLQEIVKKKDGNISKTKLTWSLPT